jgi:hypothetical protein
MHTRQKQLTATCTIFLIGCCSSVRVAKGADSTEIVLLGTLHGTHQQNARYSLDILRDLIVKLKAAAVLIELPPTIGGQPTIEKQRIAARLATNEGWSANAAADLLGIPVISCDREGRNEFYQKTKYFDREAELNRRIGSWLNTTENRKAAPAESALLGPLAANALRGQRYFDLNSGPEIINSEGYDRVIRLRHFLFGELMPQLSARVPSLSDLTAEFAFIADEWNERNQIMADNIAKEARRYSARRVVVLCGSEHRYILRDLLATKQDILLKEFYEVAPFKP